MLDKNYRTTRGRCRASGGRSPTVATCHAALALALHRACLAARPVAAWRARRASRPRTMAAEAAPPRQVTRVEVACLVHAYLAGEGFHRAAEAFRADAAELLAPVHMARPSRTSARTAGALGAARPAHAAERVLVAEHAAHATLAAFAGRACGAAC